MTIERPSLRRLIARGAAAATFAVLAAAGPALAQAPNSLTIVREVDSDRYDPPRSTARAGSEVLFMLGDTLVSLDFDMKTVKPGLAESWTVSPDGKTYTFKIRNDVSFCDGKKMTAQDVVYSIKRWADPATRSPVAWRAGPIDDVVATDDYTVEYRLKAPLLELLYQLTFSFGIIVDKANVEALGADFGVKASTAPPLLLGRMAARATTSSSSATPTTSGARRLREPRGPAHIEEIVWRIVPEETTSSPPS